MLRRNLSGDMEINNYVTVLSISTDGRRKASATSLREVGYFSPYI